MGAWGPQPHQLSSLTLDRGGGNPPVNLVPPSLSISGNGTAGIGNTVMLDPGKWVTKKPFIFTYTWFRSGVAIGGETGSTYTLSANDLGFTISAEVRYADTGGLTIKRTPETAPVVSQVPFFSQTYIKEAYLSDGGRKCTTGTNPGGSWVFYSPAGTSKKLAVAIRIDLPDYTFSFGLSRKAPSTSQTIGDMGYGSNSNTLFYTGDGNMGWYGENTGRIDYVGPVRAGDVWTILYDASTGAIEVYFGSGSRVVSAGMGSPGGAYPGYKDSRGASATLVTPYLPPGYDYWPSN